MTNLAIKSLEQCDLIIFILDGTQEIKTGDLYCKEILDKVNIPKSSD